MTEMTDPPPGPSRAYDTHPELQDRFPSQARHSAGVPPSNPAHHIELGRNSIGSAFLVILFAAASPTLVHSTSPWSTAPLPPSHPPLRRSLAACPSSLSTYATSRRTARPSSNCWHLRRAAVADSVGLFRGVPVDPGPTAVGRAAARGAWAKLVGCTRGDRRSVVGRAGIERVADAADFEYVQTVEVRFGQYGTSGTCVSGAEGGAPV